MKDKTRLGLIMFSLILFTLADIKLLFAFCLGSALCLTLEKKESKQRATRYVMKTALIVGLISVTVLLLVLTGVINVQ